MTADGPPGGTAADSTAVRLAGTADEAVSADEHALAAAQQMRGLFGRDSIYLVVWVLQVGFAALSIPINTRLLGSGGFGTVTTSLAVMQILVALGVFSLPTAVQRSYEQADDDGDARRIVTLSIFTAAITLGVALATGSLWAGVLHAGGFGGALEYAVIWASLTAVTYAALALLRSRDQLRGYGIVSLLQSAVAEVFSVLLVVLVHRTAAEFILGELLAQAVALAVALYMTRPLPIRRRHLRMVRDVLRYSGALLPAGIAAFLIVTSDKLIIRAELPVGQIARYGAIYNIAAIPVLILGILDTVWLPRFFAMTDERARAALLADSRDATSALLIPTILALSIGVPLVLLFWVPASFHPRGLWLETVTIAASGFPVASTIASRRVLLITGNTLPAGLSAIAGALVNIALNLALVPVIGIEGSALATLAAYTAMMIAVHVASRRTLVLRRPPVRLTAGCVAAVAVGALSTAAPITVAFAAARVVATLVCMFAFVVLLMRIVAPEREPPRWLRPADWVRRA